MRDASQHRLFFCTTNVAFGLFCVRFFSLIYTILYVLLQLNMCIITAASLSPLPLLMSEHTVEQRPSSRFTDESKCKMSSSSPDAWEERIRIVRRHFEAKGYRVHSGLQFGCELVLYADDPSRVHSDFCVHVVPEGTYLVHSHSRSAHLSFPRFFVLAPG